MLFIWNSAFGSQKYLEIFGNDYDTNDGTCKAIMSMQLILCATIMATKKKFKLFSQTI